MDIVLFAENLHSRLLFQSFYSIFCLSNPVEKSTSQREHTNYDYERKCKVTKKCIRFLSRQIKTWPIDISYFAAKKWELGSFHVAQLFLFVSVLLYSDFSYFVRNSHILCIQCHILLANAQLINRNLYALCMNDRARISWHFFLLASLWLPAIVSRQHEATHIAVAMHTLTQLCIFTGASHTCICIRYYLAKEWCQFKSLGRLCVRSSLRTSLHVRFFHASEKFLFSQSPSEIIILDLVHLHLSNYVGGHPMENICI